MVAKYQILGVEYDFSRKLPVVNGEKFTTKFSIVQQIINFLNQTNVPLSYKNLPAILINYRDVDRSMLVRYFHRLVDQFSTGLIDENYRLDLGGFVKLSSYGRLFTVRCIYKKRTENRLLYLDQLIQYIRNIYTPNRNCCESYYLPEKIEIS